MYLVTPMKPLLQSEHLMLMIDYRNSTEFLTTLMLHNDTLRVHGMVVVVKCKGFPRISLNDMLVT